MNEGKNLLAFCYIEYSMRNTNTTLGNNITYSKSLILSIILRQVCLCRPREIKDSKMNYRNSATCHNISTRLLSGIHIIA